MSSWGTNSSRVPRSSGFTLIELLVVIAIIGILAGLIIANAASARRVARDRRRVADIQLIKGALQAYTKEQVTPPSDLNILVPTYLPAVPVDPLTQSLYTYSTTPSGCPAGYYVVWAGMETGGITDAKNDVSCWSGNTEMIYAIVGR